MHQDMHSHLACSQAICLASSFQMALPHFSGSGLQGTMLYSGVVLLPWYEHIVFCNKVDIGVGSSRSHVHTCSDGVGLLMPHSLPFWYPHGCCACCCWVPCFPATKTLPTCHRAHAQCEWVRSGPVCHSSIVVVVPVCNVCPICSPPCGCVRMQYFTVPHPFLQESARIHRNGTSKVQHLGYSPSGIW